jgi:hypothetical protein
MMMAVRMSAVLTLLAIAGPVLANDTGLGTIMEVQGHQTPNCIMVQHSAGGWFRIGGWTTPGAGQSIHAVVLAALLSGKSVHISFTPGVTSGCGTEPVIQYIGVIP